MEIDFSDWLQAEIDKRGWTWNKLADTAGLSSGTIYNIRDGNRGVGQSSLEAIARAFQLPPETVFRAAGLLPPKPPGTQDMEEALHILAMLDREDLREIIEIARLKLDRTAHKKSRLSAARSVLKE